MKRLNKNAIKRVKSQTYLNYAECKHFGRSQTKGMYALLIAVAAMIGISIYGSCSADEDHDYGYHYGQELSTRAEKLMRRGQEIGPSNEFPTVDEIIEAVSDTLGMIWEETKSLAGPTQRQEIGVFIRYDKTTGKIFFGQIKYGKPVHCNQSGSVA